MATWKVLTTCNDVTAPVIWVNDQGQVFIGDTPPPPSGNNTTFQEFTGDGSTTDFQLSVLPVLVRVWRNGQLLSTTGYYTWVGALITFATAPLSGDDIQVMVVY